MVKDQKTYVVSDTQPASNYVPRHLSKQEFAKRLYALMMGKGWHQSELARRSGIPRDAISTYIRGKSIPTQVNLEMLAKALGVSTAELLPNSVEAAVEEENPAFEMRVPTGAPGMAWVRVNRLVTMATAVKIADLLENDRVLDRSGSGSSS